MACYLDGGKPLAFAHRGGAALWPENTLVAFEGALRFGITHIETDVHRTRDGEIVVFHDKRLERTTNGHGLIKDHSLSELERLDAGHHFSPEGRGHPWRGKGVRIPTLAALVELDPKLRFNIEMKERGVDLPRALHRFI